VIRTQRHTFTQVRPCKDYLTLMTRYNGTWVGAKHQTQHQVCVLIRLNTILAVLILWL